MLAKRSVLITTVATGLRIIASIGMVAIFARSLSLELFGSLALGMLWGQVLAILIDGGVNNEILRFAGVDSPVQHRERLNESTAVRLLMAPLPVVVAFGVAAVNYGTDSAQIMALSALAALLGALGESYFMSLRATGRHREEMTQTVMLAALMLSLPWLAKPWPAAAGLCVLLPRVLSLLSLIEAPRRALLDSLHRYAAISAIKQYYYRIRHYSLDSVVSNLGMQLDALLITLLLGKHAYALYQPTSKLFVGSLSVAPVVAGLSVPRAARMTPLHARRHLLLVFTGVGLAVSTALLPLLLWAVGPLFGPQFQLSAWVALLLSLITLLRFVAAGSGSYLTLRGRQQHRAWVNVASTVIVLVLSIWLSDSIETILIALLVSQLLMVAIYTIQSYRLDPHV